MDKDKLSQRITEDLETIDELYQRVRFDNLSSKEQELYLRHLEDQFLAVPSYIGRYARNQE